MKYGDNIMVFVSSCYYIPALPIFVAQMLWDSRFDRLISYVVFFFFLFRLCDQGKIRRD